MKMTAAQALIHCLELEGVSVLFGYPGGAVLPIYDALYGHQSIKHVLVRQEQGAVHAASGYARANGGVGVCLATSGPGATNLVTGIATAYMDSIPIVVLTGQVPTAMVGTDAFQEVDIYGITMPITKHNYLVKKAQDVPKIIKQAFYLARTGRPGPVLVDLPRDILETEISFICPEDIRPQGYKPTYVGNAKQIVQVAEAIKQAEKPVIYAGGGVISSGANDELLELAEKIKAPVVNTLMGLGNFPQNHPYFLGMLGLHGTKYANKAVTECDLLIGMGVRFDDRVTGRISGFAPDAKIIHIDIDPAEIGKNVKINLPVVGDIKRILEEVLAKLEPSADRPWLDYLLKYKEDNPLVGKVERGCRFAEIQPWEILMKLNELTKGEAIFTTDVGQHQMWSAHYLQTLKPRKFISSGGLGTMGYGFPAAVGAQLAKPEDLVIAISGDGSFQMSMQEFGTAAEQGLPIKVIILNNHRLGMVRQLQEFYCEERYMGVDYTGQPDFAMFAACYGALGLRIEKREEIEAKLKEALAHPGPVIVDCQVCGYENVYPMVLAGDAINEAICEKRGPQCNE